MREIHLLRLTRLLLTAFWSAVVAVVFLGNIRNQPFRPPPEQRQFTMALTPEGWAFFTRNPREPVDRVFRWDGDAWRRFNRPNASPENLFGFRKTSRPIGAELSVLLSQVPAGRWRSCDSALETCLRDPALTVVAVENRSRIQAVCGRFALERRPPVPWAWSQSLDEIHMPAKVVLLDVTCRRP